MDMEKFTWSLLEPSVIRKVVEVVQGDGWTIFKPDVFIEVGVPESLIKQYTRTHHSDKSSPKSTVFANGKAVNKLVGVYGLNVMDGIVRDLGLKPGSFMGRGFQARANYNAINEWLKDKGV